MNTRHMYCRILAIAIFALVATALQAAASSAGLKEQFEKVHQPKVDQSTSYLITGGSLSHYDFALTLDSGTFYPYEPVILNGDTTYYGGVFVGAGSFLFTPELRMERQQIDRFFDADSVYSKVDFARILCSDSIYRELVAMSSGPGGSDYEAAGKISTDLLTYLNEKENFEFTYRTIRNLDAGEPAYLQVNVDPFDQPILVYLFDMLDREPVQFHRHHKSWGESYVEWIVSYALGIEADLFALNGERREHLQTGHISVNATIDRGGDYVGISTHTYTVLDPPSRVIAFNLNPLLRVNKVVGPGDAPLSFVRYDEWDDRNYPLYVFLESLPSVGDTIELSFTCYGPLADRDAAVEWQFTGGGPGGSTGDRYNPNAAPSTEYVRHDDYNCMAENMWTPQYGFNQRATYDIRLTTEPEPVVVVSADKVDERMEDGRKITEWRVTRPTDDVTFNLGNFKHHAEEAGDTAAVDVYYSENLHQTLAPQLIKFNIDIGKNMERQVAEDVINATKLFGHYFGPSGFDHLQVTELASDISHSGVAYAGYINYGFSTFLSTDPWGYDRLLRSHEVAHQWWGVGVGYETYRDQWLSEGFAEYASWMYLQAIGGNKEFLKKLEDYRKELFDARKFMLNEGEELGAIGLGARSSTHVSRGDFSLVVYTKGAFVLHMLRQMMLDLRTFNEDRFLNMMRDFFTIFQGKDASTLDFRRITEKHMGEDMGWFFDQWVYDNVLPTYHFSYKMLPDSNNSWQAQCTIRTEGVRDDFFMYVPLEIEFDKDRKAYIRIAVEGTESTFTLPQLSQKPKKLRLNPFESVLADVKQ